MYTPPLARSRLTFSVKWGSLDTKFSDRLNVPAGSERASLRLQNSGSLRAAGSVDRWPHAGFERTAQHTRTAESPRTLPPTRAGAQPSRRRASSHMRRSKFLSGRDVNRTKEG